MSESTIGHVQDDIFEDIQLERRRQNAKWNGVQQLPDYTYLAIATEELGEVAQAILHDEFGGDHAGTVRDELVQLAAVVVQWLERMGMDMMEARNE